MKDSHYTSRNRRYDMLRMLPAVVRNRFIGITNAARKRHVQQTKPLKWITLFITNYCNARCEHCFYWSELNRKAPEMDLPMLEAVFGSLRGKLNTLRLSGGEPFLSKSLVELYRFIDQNQISYKLTIPTHGMMEILPKVEQMCSRASFTHLNVSVSLDGLEEHHNQSRKIPNGFAIAICNLRRLVELEGKNPWFSVSASISLNRHIALANGQNESEAERLIKFLVADVGVTKVGYDHIRSVDVDAYDLPEEIRSDFAAPPPKIGEGEKHRHDRKEDIQLSLEEMAEVNTRLQSLERTLHREDVNRLNFERLRVQQEIKRQRTRIVDCLAGTIDCVIYPNGDVAACEFTKPFSNLAAHSYDLEKLWTSHEAEERRQQIRACSCTHPCHLSDSMAYDTNFLKVYFAPKDSA